MHHCVRDVKEERLVCIAFDKADGAFGVLSRELRLIGHQLHDFVIFN